MRFKRPSLVMPLSHCPRGSKRSWRFFKKLQHLLSRGKSEMKVYTLSNDPTFQPSVALWKSNHNMSVFSHRHKGGCTDGVLWGTCPQRDPQLCSETPLLLLLPTEKIPVEGKDDISECSRTWRSCLKSWVRTLGSYSHTKVELLVLCLSGCKTSLVQNQTSNRSLKAC